MRNDLLHAKRVALLGRELDALFTDLEARFNDGKRYRLHYVTLREFFNIIKATEAGLDLSPEACRGWLLPAPAASGSGVRGCGRELVEHA
mgnify:CR=1 FL=1